MLRKCSATKRNNYCWITTAATTIIVTAVLSLCCWASTSATTTVVNAFVPCSGSEIRKGAIRHSPLDQQQKYAFQVSTADGRWIKNKQTARRRPSSRIQLEPKNRRIPNGHVLFASSSSSNENSYMQQFDDLLNAGSLGAAVRYLQKYSDQINLSRERWNRIFETIEQGTLNADENANNLRAAADFSLIKSNAREEMTDMYATLRQLGELKIYGAVQSAGHQIPAAGSHTLPPHMLERILNLPMKALTPEPTNTTAVAVAAVFVIQVAVALLTGISMGFLIFSTLLALVADRSFLNGACFETFINAFDPGIQTKVLKHEAGHFLAAYLMGCPVEGIVLSAWEALRDVRFASRQVSASTSFFDAELSRQINQKKAVTRSCVDRYSIIVMAGIAAEADAYGRTDGGAGDEMALVSFLGILNNDTKRGNTWNKESIRNQARWGALQAVLMLREYKPAYDALVETLERGGALGDCIYAIEEAARRHNLEPLKQPLGYIVEQQDGSVQWQRTTATNPSPQTPPPPPPPMQQQKSTSSAVTSGFVAVSAYGDE